MSSDTPGHFLTTSMGKSRLTTRKISAILLIYSTPDPVERYPGLGIMTQIARGGYVPILILSHTTRHVYICYHRISVFNVFGRMK